MKRFLVPMIAVCLFAVGLVVNACMPIKQPGVTTVTTRFDNNQAVPVEVTATCDDVTKTAKVGPGLTVWFGWDRAPERCRISVSSTALYESFKPVTS